MENQQHVDWQESFSKPQIRLVWQRLSSSFARCDDEVLLCSSETKVKHRGFSPHSLSDDSAPPSPPFPWRHASPLPRCDEALGQGSGGQHLPWWKWSRRGRAESCPPCRGSRVEGQCGADSRLSQEVLHDSNSYREQQIRLERWCNAGPEDMLPSWGGGSAQRRLGKETLDVQKLWTRPATESFLDSRLLPVIHFYTFHSTLKAPAGENGVFNSLARGATYSHLYEIFKQSLLAHTFVISPQTTARGRCRCISIWYWQQKKNN